MGRTIVSNYVYKISYIQVRVHIAIHLFQKGGDTLGLWIKKMQPFLFIGKLPERCNGRHIVKMMSS